MFSGDFHVKIEKLEATLNTESSPSPPFRQMGV